jgi:hypothetical protein
MLVPEISELGLTSGTLVRPMEAAALVVSIGGRRTELGHLGSFCARAVRTVAHRAATHMGTGLFAVDPFPSSPSLLSPRQ